MEASVRFFQVLSEEIHKLTLCLHDILNTSVSLLNLKEHIFYRIQWSTTVILVLRPALLPFNHCIDFQWRDEGLEVNP